MTSVDTHGVDSQAMRANKLEVVERLADDLAHEIKNPLHSMVINLEVLKRRIGRSADPEAGEFLRYVGVVAGELERVNRRVELLLRMVRPSRAGEPVSLTEMVEELLELLELERERRGVMIEHRPAPQPFRGHIPPDAARQIVLNLLLAALDATRPGGTLTVATEVEGGEERLRLLARSPAPAGNPSEDSGVENQEARLALVRAVGEAVGGRLDVAAEARQATEYLFAIPASAT